MEWQDDGIVVATRRFGETGTIIELLTPHHGRHAGLVRGGTSRRLRPVLQPGNSVSAVWRARLAEHLGSYTVEPVKSRAAVIMDDRLALAALNAACMLVRAVLPEREPNGAVYEGLSVLLEALAMPEVWPPVFVRWEMGLLQEAGFGLDLSCCAATGTVDDLRYVSPRTGRAVSADAGEPYREKLLPLPSFLLGGPHRQPDPVQVSDGLALTGYFIERHLLAAQGGQLPDARRRLADKLAVLAQP